MIIEYWIENETKIFESECLSAIQKIRNATNMKKVKLATDVYAPHAIKYLQHSIPEYKKMVVAAENKMNELGNQQIKNLESILDKESAIKELAKIKSTDWQNLRGEYAHLYRKFERMAISYINKKFN